MNPLIPAKTAFIAVHLQNDIVDPKGAFGPIFAAEITRNRTLERANALLEGARERGAAVAFVRVGFAEDYSDMLANVPLLAMGREAGALRNNTWGTEITPAVPPADADIVLTHTRTSPFIASPLDTLLRGRGVDTVVVLGVATNASVEDCARTAANLGYRTIIAAESSSAAETSMHDATLATFALFGETATDAELLEALDAGAEVSA
ncbi:MAG: cysteine hydrolase [Gammaproteobacteria bacterium]|nr:cysteine hydrolase [Gammaproteobacteria bacterium]